MNALPLKMLAVQIARSCVSFPGNGMARTTGTVAGKTRKVFVSESGAGQGIAGFGVPWEIRLLRLWPHVDWWRLKEPRPTSEQAEWFLARQRQAGQTKNTTSTCWDRQDDG